jgi:hypothetical protein
MEQIRLEDPRHRKIIELVKNSFQLSYKYVQGRYKKWEEADQMDRSYIDASAVDDKGKKLNPFDRTVFVPISRAIKDVILTYFHNVFFGNRPFIPIDGRGPEDVQPAKMQEIILDYQLEQQNMHLIGYRFINDLIKYGFGNIKVTYGRVWKWVNRMEPTVRQFPFMHTETQRTKERILSYEGPILGGGDCYRTFHDPRVPVGEIRSGQFIGWVNKRSYFYLKKLEGQPYFNLEYLRKIGKEDTFKDELSGGRSRWESIGLTDPENTVSEEQLDKMNPTYALRELAVELIPRKFGLGETNRPEIWWLTTANNQLLVRADKMTFDHQSLPTVAGEYDYDGYSLFNPGFYESIKGLQDLLNWLYNSHIDNVRRAVNIRSLVDPEYVRVRDLLNSNPAQVIRLKKSLATDQKTMNQIFQQVPVSDVTKGHLADAQGITELMQRKAHTPDALQGIETEVKRTATEIAKMTSSGVNILQTLATVIWAQTIKPLAEMCVQNNQQLLSQQRYYRIIGDYAKDLIQARPEYLGGPAILAGPEEIQGNFDFPVRDVNLPMKPSDNAQVWADVFQAAASNPLITQRIDLFWVFKQLAESMGIKNIDDARIDQMAGANMNFQVMPDEQLANQAQAGNIIPMGNA